MRKKFIKRQSIKMICMSLCCIFALNLVVLPNVQASPTFFMSDDFEGVDPLYKYINSTNPTRTYSAPAGTAITLVPNATGKAVRLAATENNSSNKDTLIGQVLDGGLTFEEGATYIFETEFSTSNSNGRKDIFRYGSSSNSALMVVRNVSGSSYLTYPNTKEGATISNSSAISDTPIQHNRTYRFTFVVDGTTRKYDLYADGVKVALNPNNNIDNACEFAPLPAQIPQSAPLRMYSQNRYLGDFSTFDNISVYKVDNFEVLNTNTDNFMALNKDINVKFTNIVDTDNAGSVSVYKGTRQIQGTQFVKGNVISLHLGEELEAATNYTLRISGTKDLNGDSIPDTDIPFTTSETLSYLNDDFENTGDFENYTFTSSNSGAAVTAAAVQGEDNKAVMMSVPAPSSGSYATTFTRYIPTNAMTLEAGKKYIFSARIKSDVNGNQRKMFVYGSGADDYLFNIKDIPNGGGYLGAFQTNVSTTRIGSWNWQAADGWIEIMAVLDGGSKTYNVFVFGQKINDEPLMMADPPEQIETIGFTYVTYSESVNYFDDIKIYTVSDFNRTYSSTEDYDVVSTYERQINLSYDLIIDPETLGGITISDDNGSQIDCTATIDPIDRRKLVIDINDNLLSNTSYTIDLSGLRDAILGDIVPENITFTTDDTLNISYPVVTNAEHETVETLEVGDITASVNVNKAKYKGEETQCTLVIAYYKGTQLHDIDVKVLKWQDISDTNTTVTATVNVDDASEGNYIKVFTMNNLEDLNPFRLNKLVNH